MEAELNKIKEIIENEYSIENFVNLVKEIFPSMQLIAPDRFNPEYSNFSSYVEGFIHIGNYITPNNKKIIVLAIQLKNAQYVENSRSAQRNYAKKIIENNNCDAAFIAFYTNPLAKKEFNNVDGKWRISFVKIDYSVIFGNGKMKANKSLTPAKRYSYLVGKGETSRTAIERIKELIENKGSISLDDIENSFSVEKVTDEFFDEYTKKFNDLNNYLKKDNGFKDEAKRLGLNINKFSEQFSKKLLGQIVFLYFLQKKGWLGVNAWPKNITEKEMKSAYYFDKKISREFIPKLYKHDLNNSDTYKLNIEEFDDPNFTDDYEKFLYKSVHGGNWGEGPKDFMRKFFDDAQRRKKNFYDDCLEPLFYDALNNNRGEDGYWVFYHCRIPFLSGSLFEPLNNYDWKHNDFNIPNEMFSNRRDENDYTGTGILDIFDRYNFTISEDEPMEKEVAIDPEMLGKLFENMIIEEERKEKGEFYTPREVVHYMCQESLINYLVDKAGTSYDSIKDFIKYGEYIKTEDANKKHHENLLISKELYEEDKDGNIINNKLTVIDDLLKNIRVADPAVGSGAFPMGMINEIVKARETITDYLFKYSSEEERKYIYNNKRSSHSLKLETIKDCIYAVDIEPSAVDIAKLRLWLSLVIDDLLDPNDSEGVYGHKTPLALPNLECNILCGNSLSNKFMKMDLLEPTKLLGSSNSNENLNFGSIAFNMKIDDLLKAQDKLFLCKDSIEKEKLNNEINNIKFEIEKKYLKDNGASIEIIEEFEEAKKLVSKPFILWQLDFARVFRDNKGFDIVIGNPPYVSTKGNDEETKKELLDEFGFADDLYSHFIFKGFNLLNNKGIITMITPDSYFTTITKSNLRQLMLKNSFLNLIHLGHGIFKSAMVSTAICILRKEYKENNKLKVVDARECKVFNEDKTYNYYQEEFKTSINQAFFVPNEINLMLNNKFSKIHKELVDNYWDKIINSSKMEKNKDILDEYRTNLKAGDITLIGLVTEGGQGLATANNGRFVGVRENTKQAQAIKETRIKKLEEFNIVNHTNYEMLDNEFEIWSLFEEIKNKYDLKAFGQGYIYKIVSPDLIADIDDLTEEEKMNGISGIKSFVRYDKGDKDGNRWYYDSPFVINWSRDNVKFFKENSGKKGNGMPVFRNPQFYFKDGFCWNNNLNENYIDIKCKLKPKSVPDVASMSLYPLIEKVPDYWIILTINNKISGTIYRRFLNATVNVQMNDIKLLPIIIPTEQELIEGKKMFDSAVEIQREFYDEKIDEKTRKNKQDMLQEKIEQFMSKVYKINVS